MAETKQTEGLVLVVDDDPSIRALVSAFLAHAGYQVETADSGLGCFAALGRMMPDVVCLDVSMPGESGLDVLAAVRERHRLLPVVMLTADTSVDSVVTAMNLGAYDYLAKPIDRAKLTTTIRNAVAHGKLSVRLAHLEREAEGRGYRGIIGRSPSMRRLFREIDRVAARDITVLINGESGSGKELVAQAIHFHSGRSQGPFVALNCAAIPETLQESELFGYEKGSFTGASARHIGRFEQANGGTLFLDEVGELSLALQAKLLRAIQERSFHRVGGRDEVQSDFRIIAATHQRLDEQIAAGSFREDFYFRIAVFELEVPSLRERVGDIEVLAQHFLTTYGHELGVEVNLSPEAADLLNHYPWPGNVRELQNAMHRAVVAAIDGVVTRSDLPARIRRFAPGEDEPSVAHALPSTMVPETPMRAAAPVHFSPPPRGLAAHSMVRIVDDQGVGLSMDEVEREVIAQAIHRCQGNMSQVVKELGIGRTTVYRKIKKYQIKDR